MQGIRWNIIDFSANPMMVVKGGSECGTRHSSDVTIKKKITDRLVWVSGWPINVSISGYSVVTASIRLTAAIDTQSVSPSC